MPRFEDAVRRLRQDVTDGEIDRAHDLEALQVALSALQRGYRIFRKPYAKRLGIPVCDLDSRMAAIVRVLARGDGESAPGPTPSAGDAAQSRAARYWSHK